MVNFTNVDCHNFSVYLCLSQICDMRHDYFGLVVTPCEMTPWFNCHKCVLHGYDSSPIYPNSYSRINSSLEK